MEGRLHLDAGHGDEGLKSLQCVVYPTTDQQTVAAVRAGRLDYALGRSDFSSSLADVSATAAAGGVSALIVPPRGLEFGPGVFTSTYVDRVVARVGGMPEAYLNSRSHLALYRAGDIDQARRALEAETVAEVGFSLPEEPLPSEALGGWLQPSAEAAQVVETIQVTARDLSALPIDRFANYWFGLIQGSQLDQAYLLRLMRGLVISTIEATVMTQLRQWRFEALAGAGYHFYNGPTPWIGVSSVTADTQRRRLEDYQRRLASSQLLDAELAWLKKLAGQYVQIMLMELEMPRPQR